ncbi:MAG: A/G-specific adenine glycosylase [Niabella sp.]
MTNLIHTNLFSNHFTTLLLKWNNQKNTRTMPWKGEKDPYKIWLSEIILQQTRVEQGLIYYKKFIYNFPTITVLAQTPENKIFKLWEGLGYYSRCRNLIATAKHIAFEKNGVFPSSYEDIIKLKGIGTYTAAAIASFAFNLPFAVLDGNVYRVLARVFGIVTPIDEPAGKKEFTLMAQSLLYKKNPGEYNQAIMDFGATVCKPQTPLCTTCVFQKNCMAYKLGRVKDLPVKAKKIQVKTRFFYFFIVEYNNAWAIQERVAKDIWQHLYQFPLIEVEKPQPYTKIIPIAIKQGWLQKSDSIQSYSDVITQKLTHQTIKAVFVHVKPQKKPELGLLYKWVKKRNMKEIAFPKIINDFYGNSFLAD